MAAAPSNGNSACAMAMAAIAGSSCAAAAMPGHGRRAVRCIGTLTDVTAPSAPRSAC